MTPIDRTELRRLATEANVTTSHVGATQEIWDAINADLQQILDDVSCWEGRHAERMCERLETAIKRLNAAVGHEREGYETAIAVGYENDRLRTRLAEVEKDGRAIRRMLCLSVAHMPYMDDGEASDQEIDFMRDSSADIEKKLMERNLKKYAAMGAQA